ncbi:hypothetical protein [Nitritalea halalkaliphila]|nr:hypothetical protein [Nitritalea halalkaliphila]
MKKLVIYVMALFLLGFSACMEQNRPIFRGAEVEFDFAVLTAPVGGLTFPRRTVANTVGETEFRVNFVSAHRAEDTFVDVEIDPEFTTAVEGVDFTLSDTRVRIPANESFGFVTVGIINTGAIGGFVDVTLKLVDTGDVIASPNFQRVQVRITRPAPPADPAG